MRVHQQLVTLLRESLPGITVLGDRGDPAPYQCDAVLLSLPRLFKTRLETIPARRALSARAGGRGSSAGASGSRKMPASRSALVWAGNPEHVNDHRRSVDLTLLAPLFAVPGASFASLQVGPRAADLKKLKGSKTDDRGSCRRASAISSKPPARSARSIW